MTGPADEPADDLSVGGAVAKLHAALESGVDLVRVLDLVQAAVAELVEVEEQRRRVMVDAVRADLDELDLSRVPGGRTYRVTALWLADVIDKRGADDGPSVTAKLADQLTKVMQALTRKGGPDTDDGFGSFQDDASTPVAGA